MFGSPTNSHVALINIAGDDAVNRKAGQRRLRLEWNLSAAPKLQRPTRSATVPSIRKPDDHEPDQDADPAGRLEGEALSRGRGAHSHAAGDSPNRLRAGHCARGATRCLRR